MKTTRTLLILALMTSIVCLFSCKNGVGGKSSDKDSTKVDTLWNEKVQDTFFGTKFGASKEEVIKNFAKHGFRLDIKYSNKDFLIFHHIPKKSFEFGGMTWENLDVYLANDKFHAIRFCTPTKDKATAISNYNIIANVLSQKYKLTNFEPKDTINYGLKVIFCKSGIYSWLHCYRYESLGKEIFYTAQLGYEDTNLVGKVSDEL